MTVDYTVVPRDIIGIPPPNPPTERDVLGILLRAVNQVASTVSLGQGLPPGVTLDGAATAYALFKGSMG